MTTADDARPRPSGIRAVIDGRTYELEDTLRYEGTAPGPHPDTGETVELEMWTIELPDLRGQVDNFKFLMQVDYLPARTGLQFRGPQPRRLA
jgi:hypothetical protein